MSPTARRIVAFFPVVCAVLAVPSASFAADEPPASIDKPAERRSGAVLGFTGGLGLAGASGYPNSASLIGSPSYYSSSNLMTGSTFKALIMGAFTDYLNFGIWFGGGVFQSPRWRSTGGGGGFRVDAFPLYSVFPKLRDLALFTEVGVGSASLSTKLPGNYPSADGTQSTIAIGAFYEWSLGKVLGGHVAAGPSIEYDVIFATSIERNAGLLGLRFVLYGGM